MKKSIRMAMIGAGIFARDAHIPAIKALGSQLFEVKAVYSRNVENAQRLADVLPNLVDTPANLDDLWERDDIDAFDIVLPIAAAPPVIERALQTGKHVFSEKPIAPTVAIGKNLMDKMQPGQLWVVGENYRFERKYQQTADLIASGEIGKPLLAHYILHMPITPDSKYFKSTWRQQPEFPGGWLLDGGVHHIAALRLILGEITEVSARIANLSRDLTSPETLIANLQFANGVLGHYSVTYATGPKRHVELFIHGEAGRIWVDYDGIKLQHGDETRYQDSVPTLTINVELQAFAEAIRNGGPNPNPPAQALQDLAVMEAILEAANFNRSVAVAQVLGD